MGPTGSGKTTLVDNLLGLLRFQEGKVLVDNQLVQGKYWRRLQNNIGYIPQHIYLTDDTIAANIAFGVPKLDRSQTQIKCAAKAAHLHNFIETLPQGYATIVGERGVRLSGGQQQRIGIARALYYDPDILVMDEATSALDNLTEKAVMNAINGLSGSKTIIMIAHRLSTVQMCDNIYLLKDGRIEASGNYQTLMLESQYFYNLAEPKT